MSDDDDPVGYKTPPKNTQFQPGQSGNPKGRPKGTKNQQNHFHLMMPPPAGAGSC